MVQCLAILCIQYILLWRIDRDDLAHLGDCEIGKTDELRDQGPELGVLCTNEDSEFVFYGLLIVIVNVTRILVAVVVVAYLNLKLEPPLL